MPSKRLHINLPQSVQEFTRFTHFPFDIRDLIWKELVYVPGIHFLQFKRLPCVRDTSETASDGSTGLRWVGSRALDPNAPPPRFTAALQPAFPSPKADKSYYFTLIENLNQLSRSCKEAKYFIDKLLERPGNLTLDNGSTVLLDRSSDIVCFDYPYIHWTESLAYWAVQLDLDQLAKVRRVAIRYNSKWDEHCGICRSCGALHKVFQRDHEHARPKSVFQFAALFKNLEDFYFLDCLTVRKQRDKSSPLQSDKVNKEYGKTGERFACANKDRTYFEVDSETSKAHTHVFRTLAWVRENYVTYCRDNNKGPADPKKVNFKVLACEWNEEELVPVKPSPPTNKRRRTRAGSGTKASKTPNVASSPTPDAKLYNSSLPVVFGDTGQSRFEFAFEMPFPTLRK